MFERTCVDCEAFRIRYQGDISAVTPGSGFQLWCAKGIYEHNGRDLDDEGEFRQIILTGATCDVFEEVVIQPKPEPPVANLGILSEESFGGGGIVSGERFGGRRTIDIS